MRRLWGRLAVCWWKGHRAWPVDVDDPFCERCGRPLGQRGSALDLPPEKDSLGDD